MNILNHRLEHAIKNNSIVSGAMPFLSEHFHQLTQSDFLTCATLPLREIDSHQEALFFLNWINQHPNTRVQIAAGFRGRIVNGTTMSFLDMYIRHANKTLILMEGEYPFHKSSFSKIAQLRFDEQLDKLNFSRDNSFAILSLPFSADGAANSRLFEFLEFLKNRSIPTLIDCALITLGCELNLDLEEYPNVEMITFSFSKPLGIPFSRIGFDFCKNDDGPIHQLNKWSYVNQASLNLVKKLIEVTPIHYFVDKYRQTQLIACHDFSLQPSPTVLFGICPYEVNGFTRQNQLSRFCLSPYLKLLTNQ